jgi:translation initiation factor IF-3
MKSSFLPHPSLLISIGGVSINTGFNRGGSWQRRDRGPSVRINERIRVKEIRVIDDEGEMIGVMTPQEALKIARERGLDLVEVAPQAQPPVCRIIDFGKYQYEQKKRAHEAKKKQVVIEVKEIKFRPATDDHDYNFKMKHAKEILQEGNKVKATVRFRGREITHKELGMQLLQRLEKDLADSGTIEVRPRVEGMQMTSIFAPKRSDKQHEKPKEKPADRPAQGTEPRRERP